MRNIGTWTLGLITLASAPSPRFVHTGVLTLRVESMTPRPATFIVWTIKRRLIHLGDSTPIRPPLLDSGRPVRDSIVATTPASIPMDSTTDEIHILVKVNAPVRIRVLDGSRELQRPTNAWGRDLKLRRRMDDRFDVVFDMRPIHPRP
jgi:hypothetical protein